MEKKEIILLLAIIMIVTLGLCYQITESWSGWFDFNGAVYSRFAKNFLTFGFLKTKMTPTWDLGNIVPEHFNYYMHHPPLLAYMMAMSFKIFGIHEWSARLVPVIFSITALFLFYLIARFLWDKTIAFLSLIFLGFTPMFLYYGRMVNQEPVFLFFYFFIIYFYLRFLHENRKSYVDVILIGFIFAYLTAWQAVYLSIVMLVHYLVSAHKDARNKKLTKVLVLVPLLFFVLYAAWIYFIKGSFAENINSIISRFGPNTVHQFSWIDFFRLEISRSKFYFSVIICIFTLLYIISLLLKGNRSIFLRENIYIIFIGLPLINVLFFREGAWEHDYQLYYFLPFFAIAATKALLWLRNYLRNKNIFKIFVLGVFILFFTESWHNFNSLQAFQFNIDRPIADKINSVTLPEEEIVTNIQISVPTSWYVDRKYTVINNVEEFQKINVKKELVFAVLFPRPGNEKLMSFLSNNYPNFTYRGVIFCNLRRTALLKK